MTRVRWPKSVFRWEATGKVQKQLLNLDPANKRKHQIWPRCWSVNGFLPISPLPLSIFCAPPWEASRQKCALAELYSYKMLLTSDKGKKPSEWLNVLWTNTSIAIKVPFLFQAGLSVMSPLWPLAQRSVVPRMSLKPFKEDLDTIFLFIGKLALTCGCGKLKPHSLRPRSYLRKQQTGFWQNLKYLNNSTICSKTKLSVLEWNDSGIWRGQTHQRNRGWWNFTGIRVSYTRASSKEVFKKIDYGIYYG